MEICLLRLMDLLSLQGYYSRSKEDRIILNTLEEKGFVKKKGNTKNIFIITNLGKAHLENILFDREVSHEEFLRIVQDSYNAHASAMKPFIKIQELKGEIMERERISEPKVDKILLDLHRDGIISLQSGLGSEIGSISNPNGGSFAYVMIEEVV